MRVAVTTAKAIIIMKLDTLNALNVDALRVLFWQQFIFYHLVSTGFQTLYISSLWTVQKVIKIQS